VSVDALGLRALREHLERDFAAQQAVSRPENDAHAAVPELRPQHEGLPDARAEGAVGHRVFDRGRLARDAPVVRGDLGGAAHDE
jgi:hypothetical protein